MRIVCPSCAATYDVPDAAVTPGRVVRCARCGTEWAPQPAGEAPPAPEPPARSLPERVIEIPAAPAAEMSPNTAADAVLDADLRMPLGSPSTTPAGPRGPGSRRAAAPLAAWLASLVLLVALAAAAYAWRAPIMAAWPPSERLYGALGLVRAEGGGRR